MRGLPREGQFAALKLAPVDATSHPAADTVAVVTIAAVADQRHVIRKITCTYIGAAPTAAGITVAIGGSTVWLIDLPLLDNQLPYDFDFPFGLYDKDNLNQAVVVTATDPGAATGCSASVNVQYE